MPAIPSEYRPGLWTCLAHRLLLAVALVAPLVLGSPALAADAGAPVFVQTITVGGAIAEAPLAIQPQAGVPAQASTTFDLTFGSGLADNPAARNAFAAAAARWSTVLKVPVSIKVNVDYAPLGENILGSTSSSTLVGEYWEVRDPIAASAATGDARRKSLVPNLPTYNQFSATMPAGFTQSGSAGTAYLTQANYLALGGRRYADNEGSITFSSNYGWDFDPTNGIDAGKYDFQGAAMHEIGHILGFMSSVDTIDILQHDGLTASDIGPFPLDLFRFDSATVSGTGFNFTTSPRDLTPGGSPVLYIGDGAVPLSGGYYTTGQQASHWADWMGLGIMDPTAAPGETLRVSDNDLAALDLIGWNLTPEPTTMALVLVGLAGLVRQRRHRRPPVGSGPRA